VVDLDTGARKLLHERIVPSANPCAGFVADAVFAPDGSILTAGDGGISTREIAGRRRLPSDAVK
jgi:hypothetical protein